MQDLRLDFDNEDHVQAVAVRFSRGGEWVSYLGATEGYCAGLHGCQIEHDSSKEFADWLESFANVFTAEMFLIDESLAVL